MKRIDLHYCNEFPWTPLSGWAGAKSVGWVLKFTKSGQPMRPDSVSHPFLVQRKKWCLMHVHFQKVDLLFATPQELRLFLEVMGRNPLPSGPSLLEGWPFPGRPNAHWLSRLPKRAKPWKYRQAICRYLSQSPDVKCFLAFYENEPVKFEFEYVFDTCIEAYKAYQLTFSTKNDVTT